MSRNRQSDGEIIHVVGCRIFNSVIERARSGRHVGNVEVVAQVWIGY